MLTINSMGNDKIWVHGSDELIVVYKSIDGGESWFLCEMLKIPGNRSTVKEIYESYRKWF